MCKETTLAWIGCLDEDTKKIYGLTDETYEDFKGKKIEIVIREVSDV